MGRRPVLGLAQVLSPDHQSEVTCLPVACRRHLHCRRPPQWSRASALASSCPCSPWQVWSHCQVRIGLSHIFFPLQTILQHLSDLPLHSRNVSNWNKVVLLKTHFQLCSSLCLHSRNVSHWDKARSVKIVSSTKSEPTTPGARQLAPAHCADVLEASWLLQLPPLAVSGCPCPSSSWGDSPSLAAFLSSLSCLRPWGGGLAFLFYSAVDLVVCFIVLDVDV